MGDNSNIEWTDATWNPIVGCSIVSPGCTNCYAMRQAQRIELMSDGANSKGAGRRIEGSSHYAGTTKVVNGNVVWTGKLALAPERILTAPLRWKKPRTIFVNSMGDLFHEDCEDSWIDQVFAVMALCPQHTFQVLTKRAERMRSWLALLGRAHAQVHRFFQGHSVISPAHDAVEAFPHYVSSLAHSSQHGLWPLPNVWLGVSAEDQRRYDERREALANTPAAVRFVSAEPLLGQIDLHFDYEDDRFIPDWIIAGGESGPKARPMHPDWARSLRDQCAAARVPYFFKQWGEWVPGALNQNWGTVANDGDLKIDDPKFDLAQMTRVGKHRAGRLLDGIEHNGMPEVRR